MSPTIHARHPTDNRSAPRISPPRREPDPAIAPRAGGCDAVTAAGSGVGVGVGTARPLAPSFAVLGQDQGRIGRDRDGGRDRAGRRIRPARPSRRRPRRPRTARCSRSSRCGTAAFHGPSAGNPIAQSSGARAGRLATITTSSPGPPRSHRRNTSSFRASSPRRDLHALPRSPRAMPPAVEPQRDQVAVQPDDPAELPAQVPVQRDVVARNHSPSRNSCPWKSIGMPGTMKPSTAASVNRLLPVPAGRVALVDLVGRTATCRWPPRRATRCR